VRLSSNLRSADIPASGPVDLGKAREITRENQRIEVMSLSHDGKWLAYDSDRSGNFDLYKIPVAGGEPVQLTTDPGNDFNPTWSPDDRQIAFHSQRSGVRHIYVTSADGSGDKLIARGPGQDYMPNWSPSSNRIAWHSSVPGGFRNFVTTLDTDGQWTPPKMLNGDEDVLGNTGPKWSPDGSAIAYSAARGLVVAPADGSPSRVLVPTATMGGYVRGIAWVASPPTICFNAVSSRDSRIYAIPAAGGTPRLILADTANRLGRADFATDGKRLYFTLAKREADVGVLDLKK
jgi:TolB protein